MATSSQSATLMSNKFYLDQLTEKLEDAARKLKLATAEKQAASDLYTQALDHKKAVDASLGKLSTTQLKAHTASAIVNSAVNLTFDEDKSDDEERSQYVIKNLGHTHEALKSLVVDLFNISECTETFISKLTKLNDLLANQENADKIKENLTKLKEASDKALESTVTALESAILPYRGLKRLMAYLPEPRDSIQPDIDALGDVTHSLKYINERSKKLMKRFDIPLKKDLKERSKQEDGLYAFIKLEDAANAESEVNAKRAELTAKEKAMHEADSIHQAIKASLDAAMAANAG